MKVRVKLFRWKDEQWKERGIGNAKLMRDREQKRVRFVMRQEKTLKPVANFLGKLSFFILPGVWQDQFCKLAEKLLITLLLLLICSVGGTTVCSETHAKCRARLHLVLLGLC